jgi:exosortase
MEGRAVNTSEQANSFDSSSRFPEGVGLGLAVLASLLVALYWSIGRDMVLQWWYDPNYSHGFVVPVFSAYLIWQKRGRLRALPMTGSWTGLPVVVAGLGMLILGVIGAENFLMRGSLILVLAGLVLFHAGQAVFREVLFPLGFLIFMVPLPSILFNAISLPLQTFAAANATWMLDAMGVPVFRDGNVIQLSHITLGVVEACSGIRSLISLLAVAIVWAHFSLSGGWAKLLFIGVAVPITIVANAARIVFTGLIGQWLGIDYAQGFFHGFSGWIIFVVAFLCLLGVHGILRRFTKSPGEASV